jgi:dTDP-glucose 4,6-dehydratase
LTRSFTHEFQRLDHLRHRRRGVYRITEAFIVNIDKLTYASNLESIPQATAARYALARQDICNGPALRALFEKHQPQAVMHLAAESHVDRSIDGPGEFIQTNIVGTFTLLQEALRYWRKLGEPFRQSFRFLHVSTDEVFGSLGQEGLFTETSSYAELSVLREQGIVGPFGPRLVRNL